MTTSRTSTFSEQHLERKFVQIGLPAVVVVVPPAPGPLVFFLEPFAASTTLLPKAFAFALISELPVVDPDAVVPRT